MTRKAVSEEKLSKLVIDCAHEHGWIVAHFYNVTVRPGRTVTPAAADGKGFPDLVLVRDKVLFVELKRDHTRVLRLEQRLWRDRLEAAGAEWHLWNPVDWRSGKIERVLEVPSGSPRYQRLLQASGGEHLQALAIERVLGEQ